jgi:hypothetical protein
MLGTHRGQRGQLKRSGFSSRQCAWRITTLDPSVHRRLARNETHTGVLSVWSVIEAAWNAGLSADSMRLLHDASRDSHSARRSAPVSAEDCPQGAAAERFSDMSCWLPLPPLGLGCPHGIAQ